MKNIPTYYLIAGAVCAFLAISWTFGDEFGFRPVYKAELMEVAAQAETNTKQVSWLRLDHYERTLKRRNLTMQECAKYRGLAISLGVEPQPCRPFSPSRPS